MEKSKVPTATSTTEFKPTPARAGGARETTWKRQRRRGPDGFTILCKCGHARADHRRIGHRRECPNAGCKCGHLPGKEPLVLKPPEPKICDNCGKPYTGLMCPNWNQELLGG